MRAWRRARCQKGAPPPARCDRQAARGSATRVSRAQNRRDGCGWTSSVLWMSCETSPEATANSQPGYRNAGARVPTLRGMSSSDPRDEPLNWTYPPQAAQSPTATQVRPEPQSVWAQPPTYGAPTYELADLSHRAASATAAAQSPLGPPPNDSGAPRRPGPPWGRRAAAGGSPRRRRHRQRGHRRGDRRRQRHQDGRHLAVTRWTSAVPPPRPRRWPRSPPPCRPSVVSISVEAGQGGDTGSGVILRSDGTIVTNNHVVEAAADGAGTISVKFCDGSTASATIVGRDPATDLAVIKASGVSGKKAATLGSTGSVHVGDTVLAIGSPLGLEGSVTSGIVSALHRSGRARK